MNRNTLSYFVIAAERRAHRRLLIERYCRLVHASVTSCIPLDVQDSLARKYARKADA